ncbi:MAG: hypothetical protein ABIE55_03010 [Candidatus Aenigmatarchaeota archaeon]
MVNIKKFLIIPVLIVAYVFFITIFSTVNFSSVPVGGSGGGGEAIGLGESLSVSVTRAYFFGLVRLPTYSSAFGYIGLYHDLFFYFIILLTVIFIIQEIKYKKKRRGAKMAKKENPINPMRIVMPVVWGFVFALVAYILSGDASSIVIGLLVVYLEYKLGK